MKLILNIKNSKAIKLYSFFTLLTLNSLFGQQFISSGELSIGIQKNESGIKILSIQKNNLELLNGTATSELFTLQINNGNGIIPTFVNSTSGWGSIDIVNNGSNCKITLTNPLDSNLPNNFTVIISIATDNKKSEWDISVSGLDSFSLHEVIFPKFNIKAEGNDYFLLPHYSGQLIANPLSSQINSRLLYPQGWDASMQFSAYYNNNYGIYFGTHDPKATIKTFITFVTNGGIVYENKIPIPNKTLSGNNWDMSGVFELDLFEGDWYDAAQIYKNWVSTEAEYWPKESESRTKRQKTLGSIGVWAYAYSEPSYSMSQIEDEFVSFAKYFSGINVGIHWYQWNYIEFDNDYPKYFPELSGMSSLVTKLQKSNSLFIMPYINGRLFDQDLSSYSATGYPYATKRSSGSTYTQEFNGNTFDVMCPTQKPWQNILTDASNQLTNRISCSGIYLDQVCASTPQECMDVSHGHKLGGGSLWRDGYKEMFSEIHNVMLDEKFITVEGGCDYLADQVDGFLVEGWTTNNLVPAFSAVYSGKVQLIGRSTYTNNYHNQAYYCKLSQALAFGIQPGRASSWIVFDSNADMAAPFLKQIATIRYKLRDFLSFGRMLRSANINGSIPNITSTWYDYGDEPVQVTISALQASTWKNKDDDKVALLFSNASISNSLSFSFDFNGSQYGLNGSLSVAKITEGDTTFFHFDANSFNKKVNLQPLEVASFVVEPDSVTSVKKNKNLVTNYKLEQNFPNPFNPSTTIKYSIHVIPVIASPVSQGRSNLSKIATSSSETWTPRNDNPHVILKVYNMLGQEVAILVNKKQSPGNYEVKFNASKLTSGIYIYKLVSGQFVASKKLLLLK